MCKINLKFKFLGIALLLCHVATAQITERERPREWDNLVKGARFIDRFLPMKGSVLSSDTWGAENVLPRYIDNGIEDAIWSYWCGSIKKADNGRYHLFVCAWLESSPKGHYEWPRSYLFDAVGEKPEGPFTLKKMIGKGHNVEAFRAKDGRYVLYVIDGRYVSDSIDGPWEYGKFDFNPRDRKIIEGLSNLSFAQREDSSYVMVCRGGGIWISEDGLSEYAQITDKRVYPDVVGEFEDPVIWKDHVQYHMIVNDWLGRIAFYLRSKDGISWVVDPGEAYAPGIAYHEDGYVENWFKYERIKMFQDEYGRAIQANLAVIDVQKEVDYANDKHSSKQITIPLNPGLLLSLPDSKPITNKTKAIRLRIQAEDGFDPQADIDISSLRFGASDEVNYGRGSKALKTEKEGNDLIVTFEGKGHGITDAEFAPKLIGKYTNGKMLYGYARLPYIHFIEPILSARSPVFPEMKKGTAGHIEVQNFGQVASTATTIEIEYKENGKRKMITSARVPSLKPYEKAEIPLTCKTTLEEGKDYEVAVRFHSGEKAQLALTFRSDYK